jgi:hypothetical protein
MKTQRQQTDYLTIKQVALEIADLVPAKTPELLAQKVYGHIRRGHLKGIKGRLAQADGSVRLVTVAHRNDVEVYKAWLKSEERSCIDIPTPALSVPSGDLRTIDLLRSIESTH